MLDDAGEGARECARDFADPRNQACGSHRAGGDLLRDGTALCERRSHLVVEVVVGLERARGVDQLIHCVRNRLCGGAGVSACRCGFGELVQRGFEIDRGGHSEGALGRGTQLCGFFEFRLNAKGSEDDGDDHRQCENGDDLPSQAPFADRPPRGCRV